MRSDAPEADLQKLRSVVNAHRPVLDILTNPVPVDLEFQVEASPAVAAR